MHWFYSIRTNLYQNLIGFSIFQFYYEWKLNEKSEITGNVIEGKKKKNVSKNQILLYMLCSFGEWGETEERERVNSVSCDYHMIVKSPFPKIKNVQVYHY